MTVGEKRGGLSALMTLSDSGNVGNVSGKNVIVGRPVLKKHPSTCSHASFHTLPRKKKRKKKSFFSFNMINYVTAAYTGALS